MAGKGFDAQGRPPSNGGPPHNGGRHLSTCLSHKEMHMSHGKTYMSHRNKKLYIYAFIIYICIYIYIKCISSVPVACKTLVYMPAGRFKNIKNTYDHKLTLTRAPDLPLT